MLPKIITKRLQAIKYGDLVFFRDSRGRNLNARGYVDIHFSAKELYINYLEVAPGLERQGYGREIYEWVENYAQKKGTIWIFLTTYGSATEFWEKMGFKQNEHLKKGNMVKVLKRETSCS